MGAAIRLRVGEDYTAYLNSVTLPIGEQYALVKVSNHFLDDAMFNVTSFMDDEAARQFGAGEASAFITGNGTDKPKGFAYAATSASGDTDSPQRAFGTYQHIASGFADSLGGDMLSSPQGDIMATLSNTVADLKAGYLPGAAWYMNPTVKATLIQMRDLDGRPLIESGLMGDPDRLLGYPIRIAEHLPNIAANALPIWFGDMKAGYTIADRTDMDIIVDKVTVKGYTLFYFSRRVGGSPTDTNVLKAIKCATS